MIELAAPFWWTGSPGFYEIFGGTISHVHGSHTSAVCPQGFSTITVSMTTLTSHRILAYHAAKWAPLLGLPWSMLWVLVPSMTKSSRIEANTNAC